MAETNQPAAAFFLRQPSRPKPARPVARQQPLERITLGCVSKIVAVDRAWTIHCIYHLLLLIELLLLIRPLSKRLSSTLPLLDFILMLVLQLRANLHICLN